MLILGIAMVSVNVSADPQLPTLFVDPPTYTGSLLGEVFTIDINVSNIQGLWGFEFKLGYNTTLLDALDAVQGPFPPPPASFGAIIYEQEGYVLAYGDCGAGSVNGSGTMTTITFKVTYEGSVSCALDLYDTKLFDGMGENIDHQVEDGNYNFVVLDITVATDKPLYSQGETVEIYGNVTLDSQPYEGLVGIEVDDPNGDSTVVRTLETGSPPPGDITIIDLYPSNLWGQPKENFVRGYHAYFFVNVSNDGTVVKNVTITVNAYDNDTVPLGVASFGPWPLAPGTCVDTILPILILEWASLGTATVYVSVFTNFPKYGGAPHCPEKSATFQITGGYGYMGSTAQETQDSGSSSTTIKSLTETVGSYNLTFSLPVHGVTTGNYTVYASSGILKQETTSSVTFENYLLGDVDGNGVVDGGDQRKIQLAMFSMPEDPNWNPNADVNGDGRVDGGDQRICQLHMFEG